MALMLPRIRSRLTFANVTSLLALFVALGTGGAYAASTIGSGDIIDNSVASADLKDEDVRNVDLKPEAIGTTRVKDGSLLGADVAPDTLSLGQLTSAERGKLITRDASAPPSGFLTWGNALISSSTAETLRVGNEGVRSTGNGGMEICNFLNSQQPYVIYVNGARTPGTLAAGSSGNPSCLPFDTGDNGDFELRAGSGWFVGLPFAVGTESYEVTGFATFGG
jgi:hypothetical protein